MLAVTGRVLGACYLPWIFFKASAAAALLAKEGFEVTLVDGAFAYWAGLNQATETAGVA